MDRLEATLATRMQSLEDNIMRELIRISGRERGAGESGEVAGQPPSDQLPPLGQESPKGARKVAAGAEAEGADAGQGNGN